MTKLFTDTSANLPLSLLTAHHIEVLPFSYTVDGKPVPYSETTDFDGKAFYDAMRAGAAVKTSMINTETFREHFTRALEAGDDVLYVGMSGGISGTAGAAALTVRELKEASPDRKIAAIDTFAASLGEGLQVLNAARMLEEGRTFEEVESYLLDSRHNMCQFFTVDDLIYLKRGGRISGAAAAIGTLLQIKPILRGDELGRIVQCGKVHGSKRALNALADLYDELALDRGAPVGIAHAGNEEGAERLLAELKKRGLTGECLNVWYEPVTGAHVGPGTVALFFRGKHK